MSELSTHYYPDDHNFVRWGAQPMRGGLYADSSLAVNLAPGDWVQHKHRTPAGKGMLVAVGDDFVTILWSIPPGRHVDSVVDDIAKQIRDEIDQDILHDLAKAKK